MRFIQTTSHNVDQNFGGVRQKRSANRVALAGGKSRLQWLKNNITGKYNVLNHKLAFVNSKRLTLLIVA